jgi:hypothetical protein
MTVKATLGSLAAAGMVAAPLTVFCFTLLLILPSDSHIIAKFTLPLLGAGAAFVIGWLVSIPLAIVVGGGVYWFLWQVGYSRRRPFLVAGPVVGLLMAMISHMLAPDLITPLLEGGWPTLAFLTSWCLGGIVLMAVFWHTRRPDRPWDDMEDRRRAGALF